jgi:hypothetical protein
VPLSRIAAGEPSAACAAPPPPLAPPSAPVALWLLELAAQLLATHTGAFACTGACALALGATVVPLAWRCTGDPLLDCAAPLPPDGPPPELVAVCPAELESQVLATQAGAFACTGACAEACGET